MTCDFQWTAFKSTTFGSIYGSLSPNEKMGKSSQEYVKLYHEDWTTMPLNLKYNCLLP